MRCVGALLALLQLASDASAERLATVSWDRRLAEGDELQVTIHLATETWRLRLRRNYGLVASGAHVLHGLEGTTLGPGPAEHCFYLGELEGAGATGALDRLTASISTCNGRLSGILIQGNRSFLLDAAEGQDQYWLRDLDQSPLQLQHEVLRFATGRVTAEMATRRLAAATKYIEVLVVNDFERYTAFGGQAGLAQLATHTVSVLNAVTGIYRAAPTDGAVFPYKVQVVLVAQHTFVTSDPWTATMVGSEVAEDSLLEAFLTWSAAEMAAGKLPENDNRLLLSGRDFVASTVGYAPLSSMCDVSRSGSINMCGASNQAIADCAATVAHEMGHNFGMAHDSGSCPQSGYVMAAVSQGQAAEQFSSCSAADLSRFFQEVYAKNGECLENKPSRVFGDPVCGNGFREDGEDCDCGSGDCSAIDPCCDGASCKFADASYHCSDAMSPCCSGCRNVTQEAQRVCRAAKSSCDRAELCSGGTAECPRDEYFYPGDTCAVTHNGKSYSGLCAMGSCHSMEYTCAVDVTRDFSGTWDLSDPCAGFNDDCQTVVCHDASSSSATECAQRFSVHGIHMPVPDGTPCWHPSEPNGQRSGMCFQGRCQRPESLAVVALCGNGGIDYGEECDCGKSADPCCDCSTCSLLNSSRCSALDACCDASCSLKAAGVVCRAATSSCDRPEQCSGSSPLCPVDDGEPWGTPCMATDGTASTCYGKACLPSLDEQCKDKTSGQKPVAQRNLTTGVAREFSEHGCTGPWCCGACNQLDGEYSVNGLRVLNPVMCTQCSWSEVSSTFTVNGVSKKIYLGAAVDGTKLADPSKICLRAEAISPSSSCGADEFLELSVGHCLPCDKSCSGCYGATALDCACCRFGVRDGRGMCPMSLDGENGEAIACTFRSTTEEDATGSSDPIGSVNQCISGRFSAVLLLLVLCLAPGRLM